jgi:MATE family, multidrug efflux pump
MAESMTLKRKDPGSYREIIQMAFPLVVSTGSWTLMHFTDRMFLSWYSQDALAAALPAGITNFAFICFFMGTATYTSTFVAQYYGSKQYKMIGPIVWQGVFFALFAGLFLFILIPLSGPIFKLIGHPGIIPRLEAEYFRILCYGMLFNLLVSVFSSFFIGLGKTRIVMAVNLLAASMNILLDYAWIFGKWGLPRWGLSGAAWASVLSIFFSALIFIMLFFQKKYRRKYCTLSGFRFDRKLFTRLLKYGLPSGVQFFLDISAFTLFVLLVGRLGKLELTASNIALNINVLAFMPMIGFSIAVGALVGQYLGENRPDVAAKCVRRVFKMTIIYMTVVALSYVLLPDIYLRLYGSNEDQALMVEVKKMSRYLLIFVAVYSIFDSINLIYCSAIRGAGDTRFVMFVSLIFSILIVVIPSYICCVVYHASIYFAWSFFSFYIIFVSIIYVFRYRGGKWKKMRVIEMPVPEFGSSPGALSESEIMR